MNALADDLKIKLLGCDPYEKFNWLEYPDDLTGGDDWPIFEEAVRMIKPNFIIEVGSWKGKSAINMTKLALQYDPDVTTLCIDTWLGSDICHILTHKDDKTWGIKQMRDRGMSTMYLQFLANVCRANLHDHIVPFPNTSSVAGRVLMQQKTLLADMIYIDACHEEDECYLDLKMYWSLVRPGGVMFGDDFAAEWYGVICAVNRFVNENKLHLMIAPGGKWVLQKELETGQ